MVISRRCAAPIGRASPEAAPWGSARVARAEPDCNFIFLMPAADWPSHPHCNTTTASHAFLKPSHIHMPRNADHHLSVITGRLRCYRGFLCQPSGHATPMAVHCICCLFLHQCALPSCLLCLYSLFSCLSIRTPSLFQYLVLASLLTTVWSLLSLIQPVA